ncbi:MAG TPA: glycine zipper 2TM domain-containing protein [Rhodocyclaceae bacterium]|nr:glycine zipper 2TM domain-containing protein [Rhodocyclaceae bacterium]
MSDITPNTPTPATPSSPTALRSGLHPALWVAASAVTVCALAGTAYFTGLLPRHDAAPATPVVAAPAAPVAEAPAAPVAAAPAVATDKAVTVKKTEHASAPRSNDNSREYSTRNRSQYSQYGSNRDDNVVRYPDNSRSYGSQPSYAPPPAICRECGTIESVRAVTREGEGSGLGAVAGGVVGGALGNGVGQGTGRDLATIAGAIGGAVLGNKIEKNQRQTVSYQTVVRFEDGNSQTFTTDRETAWRPGDRVKVINGQIVPR